MTCLQQRTVTESAQTTFEIQMVAVVIECDLVEIVDDISTFVCRLSVENRTQDLTPAQTLRLSPVG